jgi:hypothetical protein
MGQAMKDHPLEQLTKLAVERDRPIMFYFAGVFVCFEDGDDSGLPPYGWDGPFLQTLIIK